MRFSTNWLREFIELPAEVDQLAELLTFAGLEIEGIEKRGGDFDKVIVAQINASAQHPNADRLSVCQVDDGSGQTRQIVCGAKNYKVGDKVPLALPGAALPNALTIKVSKLRGVESQGMLCSPSELKMSEDSDGLLILSPDAPVGAPLGSLFPPDAILDVEVTPNRGDLLSYVGLAREIAALSGKPPRLPQIAEPKTSNDSSVKIAAHRECPFYSARRIENITVGQSPDWLRAKLEAAGLRSISSIVDITNFVMLELGQPLHAFDADKLQGGITVRLALPGETFLALDGKTYSLGRGDLMIADDVRAVGIGGVMGGEETGVTASTRNVLLESAYFLPSSVRRTARTLNLPSDASYRFERGVDPAMTLRASARAAHLIREIAGGQPSPNVAVAGEVLAAPANVRLRYQRCDQLLGVPVPRGDVDRGLRNFGLLPANATAEGTTWKIPSYRGDLKREADLIEEVSRQYGINKIPGRNRSLFTATSSADRAFDFETALRRRLVGMGLFEARTSALISRADALSSSNGAVELKNPLSEDHVALRPSLISGLLDVLGRNQNLGARSLRLFELGRIFIPEVGQVSNLPPQEAASWKLAPHAKEQRALGLLFCGHAATDPHWHTTAKRQLDFFDLKSGIEALRIPKLAFWRADHPAYAMAAEVRAADEVIGMAGQLSGARAAALGAAASVFVAQLDLDAVFRLVGRSARFREIDRYPAVTRDIAMIVPESLTHAEIEHAIADAKEPLLVQTQVFDVFSGEDAANLGPGRKSMAYTLTYRDKNRTLTNDEVTVVHTRIRERLKRELGAELRE